MPNVCSAQKTIFGQFFLSLALHYTFPTSFSLIPVMIFIMTLGNSGDDERREAHFLASYSACNACSFNYFCPASFALEKSAIKVWWNAIMQQWVDSSFAFSPSHFFSSQSLGSSDRKRSKSSFDSCRFAMFIVVWTLRCALRWNVPKGRVN